uniref:Interferon-induced protein 44-like n=1 Tax=Astyanax mexicanus TaxID=7994 RepID=A0A3B1IZW7_ASTMX
MPGEKYQICSVSFSIISLVLLWTKLPLQHQVRFKENLYGLRFHTFNFITFLSALYQLFLFLKSIKLYFFLHIKCCSIFWCAHKNLLSFIVMFIEFDEPWRPVTWSGANKEDMLQKLRALQVSVPDVNRLNILLHGPIGAGKSSFINSVNTVLQGHNTTAALADSSAGKSYSFTVKFKYHRLKKGAPGIFYPFSFADIMGLEPGSSSGVHIEDIVHVLNGRIKSGYVFNPVSPIAEGNPSYNSEPSLKDRVHCLVSVLPADNISLISNEVIQKMKDVREKARNLDIPQVVLMSMVDKACPLVNDDLKKIYTSKKIKDKMKECRDKLGVPMNCIYPVRNYHEQVTNDLLQDVLILMPISDIIRFANSYVEDQVYTE